VSMGSFEVLTGKSGTLLALAWCHCDASKGNSTKVVLKVRCWLIVAHLHRVLRGCRLRESAREVRIALVVQVRSGLLLGADHLVGGSSRRTPPRERDRIHLRDLRGSALGRPRKLHDTPSRCCQSSSYSERGTSIRQRTHRRIPAKRPPTSRSLVLLQD
jgi:hypothetical protein